MPRKKTPALAPVSPVLEAKAIGTEIELEAGNATAIASTTLQHFARKAAQTLGVLLDCEDPHVQLKAATAILDRIGLVAGTELSVRTPDAGTAIVIDAATLTRIARGETSE